MNKTKRYILSGLKGTLLVGLGLSLGPLTTPKANNISPEITLPGIVTSIYDGDTCTVEFNIKANIRMLNSWSPELNEKGGKEAKENLERLCPINSNVMVKIPIYENLSKSFTFGRVLGSIYKDGQDLSELQVKQGFATNKKEKQ